ncbi:DUF4288 domain-containing protein [Limnoglobus roseus]|uniref:DUF4288 domain-containing protein n=1 Tax=Limnoglobus roseus TaxID=2598579 RepID=UPI0011EAFA41
MNRYAAKLLFQFRVRIGTEDGKKRLCEERIVAFQAVSARAALTSAKRRGKSGEHSYANGDGNAVYFEFIGVMELVCLDPQCGPDEVWYEIKERLLPKERKRRLIPPESVLEAIRNEPQSPSTRVTRR